MSKRFFVGGFLGWSGSLLIWHIHSRDYHTLRYPREYVEAGCITTGVGAGLGAIIGATGLPGVLALSLWGGAPLVSYYRKRSLDPNAKRVQIETNK